MMVTACPECGAPTYYSGSECISCGWHKPGATILHADFAPSSSCEWCNQPTEPESE